MIRCAVCRHLSRDDELDIAEHLPGTGYRCSDRAACARRVTDIVNAHRELREICGEV